MGTHALLSPSAAHRWLDCTAAPRLEADASDETTDYAVEGTLAHAHCARKLKEFLGSPVDRELQEIAALSEYQTGEMDEYTDTYKTIVLEKFNAACAQTRDAQLLVETRLDLGEWVPQAFGTADAIIIADGTMEVIDFKYGKGVKVSAYRNPQMMIYALGAYDKFCFEYRINKIRMTIVQPRIDNLSEFLISTPDLIDWQEKELTPRAKQAYDGDGPQVPGTQCQFCKVKSYCRALTNLCTDLWRTVADPKLLKPDELATKVLPLLPVIKTWLAGLEEYALQQALSGVKLPGWKIVEGRSNRRITDADGAVDALRKAGFPEEDIYKPKELRTITDLESMTGKKQFAAICGKFVDKPKGKPTLVPESDKRKAIDPVADDFKDVQL